MIPKSENEFHIGGQTVLGGETKTVELPAARLYTQSTVGIPVRVVCGKKPGPRLFVSGAIHGDEINGVEIIHRLLTRKELQKLRGVLVAVPVVNVHGFIARSRYSPDRRDLNRSFPGSEDGSLAARLAWLFMREVVNKCTHGIDLHTASNHRFNLPHVRARLDNEEIRNLAETFGAPVILNTSIPDGTLRKSAQREGLPILNYEAGEALRFDELSIRLGVAGILSVMKSLGMLPGKPHRPKRAPFVANSSFWVRAAQSGVFRPVRPLGARVDRGEVLGEISDPLGEDRVEVKTLEAGVMIGELRLPLAYKGDALFHIAKLDGSEGEMADLSDMDDNLAPDPEDLEPEDRS